MHTRFTEKGPKCRDCWQLQECVINPTHVIKECFKCIITLMNNSYSKIADCPHSNVFIVRRSFTGGVWDCQYCITDIYNLSILYIHLCMEGTQSFPIFPWSHLWLSIKIIPEVSWPIGKKSHAVSEEWQEGETVSFLNRTELAREAGAISGPCLSSLWTPNICSYSSTSIPQPWEWSFQQFHKEFHKWQCCVKPPSVSHVGNEYTLFTVICTRVEIHKNLWSILFWPSGNMSSFSIHLFSQACLCSSITLIFHLPPTWGEF